MKNFPIVRLRKVLRQRSEFVEIDDFTDYKRCRVQWYGQGIIERDFVPGTEIKTKKQQVCRAQEFLVAEIDAKSGGFGIVPDNLDGAIVSGHYFLFVLDKNHLDPSFLKFFIRTSALMEQVRAQGTTNYAAIRPDDVLEYEIPLPPLEEQHHIVARIEELAARIEEARGLKHTTLNESKNFWKVLSRIAREADHPTRTLEEIVEFLDGRRIPLSESQRASKKGPYPYYGASGIVTIHEY